MPIAIEHSFTFAAPEPTDLLLQFEAAIIPEQRLLSSNTHVAPTEHFARVAAQDGIGERIWARCEGECEVFYSAQVEVERLLTELAPLRQLPMHELPGETVKYLFDSRYCAADKFQSFVEAEFGDTQGGARVVAMRDWIAQHFTYAPGASNAATTARDSFVERRGICRDFAHVMVTLARASGIPARYVSCFAPGVTPQDFHAVAEAFLEDATTEGGGAWFLVDATGMAEPAQVVKIGVGRDAADVSFMTSFGEVEFSGMQVSVEVE